MEHKKPLAFFLASVLCLVAVILSLCLGAANLSLKQLWQAILNGPHDTAGWIFYYARLPRTAACLLSGAALAVSGAVIQNVLHNQLASPSVIGVNAGAGLAVTLCCAFGALSGLAIALSSFVGAMFAVLLVMLTAKKTGASRTTVILGGMAVNSFLNALSEAIKSLFPNIGVLSSDFRIGGFSSVAYTRLIPAGILIIIALLLVCSLRSELDILSLGDETAQSLGLPVKKMRTVFLILAALLSGASVSFAGLLSFVGLIIPHSARKLIGSQSQALLPFCAILGAGFVTLCDLFARLAFQPYELPVGILLSILGGPFFILLLLKKKGGRIDA